MEAIFYTADGLRAVANADVYQNRNDRFRPVDFYQRAARYNREEPLLADMSNAPSDVPVAKIRLYKWRGVAEQQGDSYLPVYDEILQ